MIIIKYKIINKPLFFSIKIDLFLLLWLISYFLFVLKCVLVLFLFDFLNSKKIGAKLEFEKLLKLLDLNFFEYNLNLKLQKIIERAEGIVDIKRPLHG